MSSTSTTQILVSWITLLGICTYFIQSLRQKSTQENWWGMGKFVPKVDSLIDNGRWSNPQNYQQQLPYPNRDNGQQQQSSYFYQVPGNAQSALSPRILPQGLSDKVQYNLPALPQMGLEPFNPMSLARNIQCPPSGGAAPSPYPPTNMPVKEHFDYTNGGRSTTSAEAQQTYNALQQSAGNEAASRLPIPTMISGNAQASGDTPVVNYDRFIVANLSRNRGAADFIRGDLFINPILPDSNTNSLIMFRPSQGTEVLNTGAMAVLTGAYNETNAKTSNLAMAGNGGAFNTFSGVAWARPESSSVGRQIAVNADVLSQKGMGTTNFGDATTNVSMTV